MLPYFKLIRLPNLLIVAILQFILYFGILIPVFKKNSLTPVLNDTFFGLMVVVTLIVTAAGYVINDYLDVEIDKLNKPEKLIVTKQISKKNTLIYYFSLFVAGLIISLIIAIHIEKIYYLIIYFFSFLFLYYYSLRLKRKLLIGNIVVSAFSALVLAIILFFEYPRILELKYINPADFEQTLFIFIGFMIFSFLISLYREIVKDIEDVKGDMKAYSKTLPIVYGIEISKGICGFISILILFLLFIWLKVDFNYEKFYLIFYVFVFIMLPLFYSVYLLKNASTKKDFNELSGITKLIMISGILLLLFYI